MRTPSNDKIVEAAVALAEAWQNRANELLTAEEKGIAQQAYLPDSYDMQKELTAWAGKRVASGGSPIRIRIVKGANMEMEQLEAAIHNWPLAPYDNKLDVDANYKRMVDFGMVAERIKAVHLGPWNRKRVAIILTFGPRASSGACSRAAACISPSFSDRCLE